MGLPMWKSLADRVEEAKQKPKRKTAGELVSEVERSQADSRSNIRRQPSIHHGRRPNLTSLPSNGPFRMDPSSMNDITRRRPPPAYASTRMIFEDHENNDTTSNASGNAASTDTLMPPLRRMGNRTINPDLNTQTPQPESQGSPEETVPLIELADSNVESQSTRPDHLANPSNNDSASGSEEGGTWDSFVTTITPDPTLPSAGSSFASAAAASSFNANNDHNNTTNNDYGSGNPNANANDNQTVNPVPQPQGPTDPSELGAFRFVPREDPLPEPAFDDRSRETTPEDQIPHYETSTHLPHFPPQPQPGALTPVNLAPVNREPADARLQEHLRALQSSFHASLFAFSRFAAEYDGTDAETRARFDSVRQLGDIFGTAGDVLDQTEEAVENDEDAVQNQDRSSENEESSRENTLDGEEEEDQDIDIEMTEESSNDDEEEGSEGDSTARLISPPHSHNSQTGPDSAVSTNPTGTNRDHTENLQRLESRRRRHPSHNVTRAIRTSSSSRQTRAGTLQGPVSASRRNHDREGTNARPGDRQNHRRRNHGTGNIGQVSSRRELRDLSRAIEQQRARVRTLERRLGR
ncbi:MAG: hypothetical protein M1831_003233 [Alyxoria varia]|nr:MAG: hypothetical protein M1831_003233 [Alyxoria varia]